MPHVLSTILKFPAAAPRGLQARGIVRVPAKYLDHLPLYRQEQIFSRAGLALPRSTLAQWVGACGPALQPLVDALKTTMLTRTVLHADETPVPMLKPGLNRTHRAYLWSYSSSEYDALPAVVYDFAEGRSGQYARDFLGSWSGKLVCDNCSGYMALFERGVIEVGCLAHARRKFHELYANHRSELAEEALRYFSALYESLAREQKLDAQGRRQLRQQRSKPIAEALRQWLTRQRGQVPDGSATAKDRVRPRTLGGIDPLPGGWRSAHRQQSCGKPNPAGDPWTIELVVCWFSTRWKACGQHHEFDPVCKAQSTRSVPVFAGCTSAGAFCVVRHPNLVHGLRRFNCSPRPGRRA